MENTPEANREPSLPYSTVNKKIGQITHSEKSHMHCAWGCLAEALISHMKVLPTNSRFIMKQKEKKNPWCFQLLVPLVTIICSTYLKPHGGISCNWKCIYSSGQNLVHTQRSHVEEQGLLHLSLRIHLHPLLSRKDIHCQLKE